MLLCGRGLRSNHESLFSLTLCTACAGSEDAVGTTGSIKISPNAVNSVPRSAVLEIDIRDIDGARRDATVAAIVKEVGAIAKRRRVRHTVDVINQDPPATCDQKVCWNLKISAVNDLSIYSSTFPPSAGALHMALSLS